MLGGLSSAAHSTQMHHLGSAGLPAPTLVSWCTVVGTMRPRKCPKRFQRGLRGPIAPHPLLTFCSVDRASTQFRRILALLGQFRSKFGPTDHTPTTPAEICPTVGRFWRELAILWANSAILCQPRSEFGQLWPKQGPHRPSLAELGQMSGQILAPTWLTHGLHRPELAELEPNLRSQSNF